MVIHVCKNNNSKKIKVSDRGGITPINGKIYWHIDENYLSPDLDKYKIIHAIQKAFKSWQKYINPIFEACSDSSKCQIVFKFMLPDNPDLPFPYDGALAYAFFPERESLDLTSDVYVNDIYNWGIVHTSSGYNLFKVLVHEIGHSLGLEHSNILSDIMYPQYQPNDDVVFSNDTIQGIINLYGEKFNSETCIIDFLQLVFKNKNEMNKLYEREIVEIANLIGIEASKSDLKSETINKIFNLL